MRKVGVVGAGTMGHGIAQVFAMKEYDVTLVDHEKDNLAKAVKMINLSLDKLVEKGRLANAVRMEIPKRVRTSTDLKALDRCELVIEAVTEKAEVKKEVFQQLDKICPKETIIATNTSSISISKLGAFTKRPGRVIGMHFFNPPVLMELVEVIRGIDTSQKTYDEARRVCQRLGKTPVEIKDFPGFVANRLSIPLINEAIFVLMDNIATREEIDTVMKLGMHHPMGPLELADFIGLDVVLHIMENLYEEYEDSKYRVCPLLKKMVEAGHLGRKAGKGFYEYDENGRKK
ncbi:MAG: 3-hydroxybutyryl-CoA dehydrogenase [Candidatus Aenigmarchaeota archaeon]|nr:3-hydroxybutyryl-CoA dehydrogenase [Candidatus Aenigmarchaeota archaeon]